ncbi:MAG: hypothetical protein ACE5FF_06205 [Saprospiraceae bacterium]
MNKITLATLFFSILFFLSANEALAAIAKSKAGLSEISQRNLPGPAIATKKVTKKDQRLKKRVKRTEERLAKRFEKMKNKPGRLINSSYLTVCLILFVAAVLFFAIGGPIFGIFGSVASLGSAVFFVLWLLEYTGNL